MHYPGGFASPPQLDLYLRTPYYKDGKYQTPAVRDARGKIRALVSATAVELCSRAQRS